MNSRYVLHISQIESSINEIEDYLITDITNEMTENGYVKFYFDGFEFIFQDIDNKKYPVSDDLRFTLDMYYGTLNREKIEINI